MHEHKSKELQNPSTSSAAAALIAFKPRQVLLAQSSKSRPVMAKKQPEETTTITALKPQHKSLVLLQSVVHYLHLNGFSKTLKRFLKEAQIEGDSWKSCSLNLEDMFCKHLNTSSDNDTTSKGHKEPEQCEDGTKGDNLSSNSAGPQETICEKKKKKSEDKDSNIPDASHPETVDKCTKYVIDSQEVLADDKEDVAPKKPKDKKKKKTAEKSEVVIPIGNDDDITGEATKKDKKKKTKDKNDATDHNKEKPKDKKKKKTEEKSEVVVPIGSDNNDITGETAKKDKKKKTKEENGATDPKDSKKRKRLASDENVNQGVDGVGIEESKRQKTDGLEESKAVGEQGKSDALSKEDGHAGNGNQEQNGKVSIGELNSSAKQKSSRERNGSAEPKTVNAFQRVKVDQVEFIDDRLRDNSYWAKNGAEVGYGAKAQEILGQVKGRDFRHEKTKKKRGSYRGGQIDLQSHSIKFSYSDEE